MWRSVRAAVSRDLSSNLISALIVGVYCGILLLVGFILYDRGLEAVFSALIVIALGALFYPLLSRWLALWSRSGTDGFRRLEQFVDEKLTIVEPDQLHSYVLRVFAKSVNTDRACLVLPSSADLFVARSLVAPDKMTDSVVSSGPFTALMKNDRDILGRADIEALPLDVPEKKLLDSIGAEILVLMKTGDRLNGVLILGKRASGKPYDERHLDRLRLTTKQLAAVLEGARMYAEAKTQLDRTKQLAKRRADFLEAVSHQLKTPITAIKASADMLREHSGFKPASVQSKLMDSINRNLEALEKHVGALLDFARIEDGVLKIYRELTDPCMLIREVVTQASPLLENKKQVLTLNLPETAPSVFVDRYRFEQILLNLLDNASKFTPENGKIDISVSSDPSWLLVSVSDSGPGIPKQDQASVFDAYYESAGSDTRLAGGGGLGLAIARALVKLHGGNIWVESNDGEGSKFTFSIPLEVSH